jgi:hypothetical protein
MVDKKERKDSDIEIKVEELLRDLDLNDDHEKSKRKPSIDIIQDEKEDSEDDKKAQSKNRNQLGKRERTGKKEPRTRRN